RESSVTFVTPRRISFKRPPEVPSGGRGGKERANVLTSRRAPYRPGSPKRHDIDAHRARIRRWFSPGAARGERLGPAMPAGRHLRRPIANTRNKNEEPAPQRKPALGDERSDVQNSGCPWPP